jgi:hypothetical protein
MVQSIFTFQASVDQKMNFERQAQPIPNSNPSVWLAVIDDMNKRNDFGIKKYGTPLQPNNGRDSLRDAYEELLDLVVYLKQYIIEKEIKSKL